MKSWYALTTKPSKAETIRAKRNLDAQSIELYDPRVTVRRLDEKEIVMEVNEQAFPGYLFVRFDPKITSSSTISYTKGVRSLVRRGLDLAVMPDELMADMISRFDDVDFVIDETSIREGEEAVSGFEGALSEGNAVQRAFALAVLLAATP